MPECKGALRLSDPSEPVDKWPLPSLTLADRKRIKALLLKAHATILRTSSQILTQRLSNPIQTMARAFNEIAKVLFDADLLTTELLEKQLPMLLAAAAATGGWLAREVRYSDEEEVPFQFFPGYVRPIYPDLLHDVRYKVCQAEIAKWRGKLLEREVEQTRTAPETPTALPGPELNRELIGGAKRQGSVPTLNYRSEVKRAILIQLTKKPRATMLEICRALDADGAVDLPAAWKRKREDKDRMFVEAYLDPNRQHKVEVTISRVRSEMRRKGLLPQR